MRESPPTGAEATLRQVARVRRRQNVHTAVRALCALLAVAAGVLAALLTLALAIGPGPFTAACAILSTTFLFATGWLVLRAARDWLGVKRAPRWIDRRAGLEGRLFTLLELRPRAADAFFLPLLEEQNRRRVSQWEPQRLVPDPVPRGALAAAVVALTLFASVIALAPRLAPTPPRVGADDEPMHAVATRPGEVPLYTGSGGTDIGTEPAAHAPAAEPARERETSLARTLQRRIREELWGDGHTELTRRPQRKGTPSAEAEGAASESSWQVADGGAPGDRRPRGREEAPPRAQLEAAGDEGANAVARPPENAAGRPGADGGGASGAGTGTDPALYGAARGEDDTPSGRFELGIAARVRTRRAAPRPPTGETPPAAPDEHPVLGARQRIEVAVRRMMISPAYEPIVRRVFAHGEEDTP
jgi:hypothetical protein